VTSLIQILFNAPFRRSSRSTDITTPRDAQSLRKAASLHGLHALRTRYESEQHKMKNLVLQGAPHLTLQLWDLQDIQFSRELPITQRMRDRRLDLSNADKVLAARLPSAPGSSSRTSSNATCVRSGVGRHLTVVFPSNRKSESPRQWKTELIKLAASTTLQGRVRNHRNLLLSSRYRLYTEVEPQLRVGTRFSLSSLWLNPR
jgi:hypothetical protein